MSDAGPAEIKLEFDTPQLLHDLFANAPKNLAYLEEGTAFQRFSQADIIRHPVDGRIVEAYERHRA